MSLLDGLRYFQINSKKHLRFYRSCLTKEEQDVYDELVDGFLSLSERISVRKLSFEQIKLIYEKVLYDNPCIFYVKTIQIQYAGIGHSGYVIPEYRFSREQVNATLREIINKCRDFINKNINKTEIEKEIAVHNFLCETVVYDYNFSASSFQCVGPLLFGRGVCEGISKAAKFLFNLLGIESLVVCGEVENASHSLGNLDIVGHAWNIVKINQIYYHLDITFDLTIAETDVKRFDYFNLTDTEIYRDHKITSKKVPSCSVRGSYYFVNNLVMNNQLECKNFLMNCIKKRERDIVFQIPQGTDIEKAKKKILSLTQECLLRAVRFYKEINLFFNPTQYVFHVRIK